MALVMMILGILMIIEGIICIATSVATFSALGWLAGIAVLTVGLSSILQYTAGHEERSIWQLLGGICGILFGGFLIVNIFAQVATNVILAYAAALWLLVRGIRSIVKGVQMRKVYRTVPDDVWSVFWLEVLAFGVLTVLVGIACIMQPMFSMISAGWLMGSAILTAGVDTLVFAFSLRKGRGGGL